MRTVSLWASRHARLAIFLIILGEIVNGFNGVLLGANVLGHLPIAWLYAGMLVLIGLAISIQYQAKRRDVGADYWSSRRWLFVAFLSNYLLFSLLGGIWAHRINSPSSESVVLGSRRIYVAYDTIPAPDSVPIKSRIVVQKKPPVRKSTAVHRGKFVLLGLVGIVVTSYLVGLSCGLACAGYGFLALLTFYLGLGGMAGSVYFFSRAGSNLMKRRRDMTDTERQRDSKRFWLAWLILIGIFSIIFLAAAISK